MDAQERIERAKKAGQARWEKTKETGGTLKATHTGELVIGDIRIPCAVLEDGRRILSETGIKDAIGSDSGQDKLLKRQAKEQGAEIPIFLVTNVIKPLIINKLSSGLFQKISYMKGRQLCHGYPAELLPEVCEIWLEARDTGLLQLESQLNRAKKADMLIRALAKIGVTALVDEATGYQEERDRSELQKLLSKYIAVEFMPWQKRFPTVYYRELFRLFGWKFDPSSVKRPALIGKFTNDYIYAKMPEGVLEELRNKNPSDDSGNRRTRHHQWLTQTIGVPHLDKHLVKIVTVMKLSDSLDDFKRMFAKIMEDDTLIDVSLEETTDSADNIQVDTKSKKLIDKTK